MGSVPGLTRRATGRQLNAGAYGCSAGRIGPPNYPRCAAWTVVSNSTGQAVLAGTVTTLGYYQPVFFSCATNLVSVTVRRSPPTL